MLSADWECICQFLIPHSKFTICDTRTPAYLAMMVGGIVVVVWAITGFAQLHMAIAFPLMLLQATFLLTVSIAGGTRLSAVTTGIVTVGLFGLAFMAGLVEQIGAFSAKFLRTFESSWFAIFFRNG